MFPTLASVLEERLRDQPDATHAVVHAFNQWLHETWSFDHEGRIFTTPVITLPIVERAIEELEWVVQRGARAVLIRPAPAWGLRGPRSPGLAEFDPFWEKVVESGVLVAMHSSDSGYERYVNEWVGTDREFLPFEPEAFGMVGQWRPIEDAVASMVCHGALSRFPELKIAVVENGSSWVEPLLRTMADLHKKMPQDFLEDPVEVIKRNIFISPFWEEDLGALAELLGVDQVLFGSDYPHPEGMADPASYLQELADLPDEWVRKIMGGNLARLVGVDLAVAS
jgi:predicted TIM-barrel fold metal-dependent hydrolase